MTGDELRAALVEFGISRRQFADELATEGYQINPETVKNWKLEVPRPPAALITRWQTDPATRPASKAASRRSVK